MMAAPTTIQMMTTPTTIQIIRALIVDNEEASIRPTESPLYPIPTVARSVLWNNVIWYHRDISIHTCMSCHWFVCTTIGIKNEHMAKTVCCVFIEQCSSHIIITIEQRTAAITIEQPVQGLGTLFVYINNQQASYGISNTSYCSKRL